MKSLKISILAVLLYLLPISSFAGSLLSKEAVNYYNEAIQAEKEEDILAAKSNYAKAVLTDPDNLKIQRFVANNMGVMYARGGNLDKAEDSFKEALSLDPTYRLAQLNLGLIYDKQIDKVKANCYWLKIFVINLEEAKPKTFVMLSLKDYNGRNMILADPKDIDAQKILLNNSGIKSALSGNMMMAESEFNEALKLDPDYWSAQLNLGLVYDRQPDKLVALEYWLKLFKIDLDKIKPKDFILEDKII